MHKKRRTNRHVSDSYPPKISKKITPLRRLLNFYDYFLDYLFIFLQKDDVQKISFHSVFMRVCSASSP
nr:MAG TPA: hypothetical protein [Caudoviricetes sp.]